MKMNLFTILLATILILSGLNLLSCNIGKADPGDIAKRFPSPGPSPTDLSWDGTYLWCADDETDKFYKIDIDSCGLEHCEVRASFDSPKSYPTGLTCFWGEYWYHEFTKFRLYFFSSDGASNDIYCRHPDSDSTGNGIDHPGTFPSGLTIQYNRWEDSGQYDTIVGKAYIWIADSSEGVLYRRNFETGETFEFRLPNVVSHPTGLAFKDGCIFTADANDGKIYKLDINPITHTLDIKDSWETPGTGPSGLTMVGEYLFHSDKNLDQIYKIQIEKDKSKIQESNDSFLNLIILKSPLFHRILILMKVFFEVI